MSIDENNTPGLDSVELPETIAPEQGSEQAAAPAAVTVEKIYAHVNEVFQVFGELKEPWDPEAETMAVPSGSFKEVNKVIDDTPNVGIIDSPVGRDWGQTLHDSFEYIPQNGGFEDTVERKDGEFTNVPKSTDNQPLTAAVPNLRFNTGEKVSGERAVLRMRSLLGMGTIVQVPLWHSGFWITIKAPSEASLLELQRRLIEAKVNLGRQTHGIAYANTSVFIVGWLTDFILAHVYDTTIKEKNIALKEQILATDIMTLAWGLATTIWPAGFQYKRACITDPEKCNHVVQAKINLGKLLWVDMPSLTSRQVAHMASRGGSTMSLESIKNYREDFERGRDRVVSYGPNDCIKVTFSVPTVLQYINSGYNWVNTIVNMVNSSFAEDPTEGQRDLYISEMGRATGMRQFCHWVKSIDGAGMISDDAESIEQILDTLTSDDVIRKKFFEDVKKYIDESTIALVAVPSYTCPKCNNAQELGDDPKFKHLLPIDAISTFFTLVVPRLQKIRSR